MHWSALTSSQEFIFGSPNLCSHCSWDLFFGEKNTRLSETTRLQHYFHLRTVTFQKEKHLSFSYFVFLCLSALLRTQSLSSQAFEILNDSPHQNSNILPSWSWASRFPDGHWIIVWNPIIIDSLHGSVKIVKNRKCICDILATLYGICNHTPGPESFSLSLIVLFYEVKHTLG